MKKIASSVVVFTLAALIAWPYLYLYRLDRAVAANDFMAFAELVDADAVRSGVKSRLGKRVDESIGARSGSMLGWIQEGVKQIGGRAVDIAVDHEWIMSVLRNRKRSDATPQDRSLLSDTTYAFFEGWDRFLVRVGELEQDPIHIRMALQQWRWRVVGVFE